MERIITTHLGEDYGTVEVDGKEFETSLGLAEAIFEVGKTIEIHTEFIGGLPLGSTYERDGKKYKVTNNNKTIVTTAVLIEYECDECEDTGEVSCDESDGEGHIMRGVGTQKCICQVE